MDHHYLCAHCNTDLGVYVEGSVEPVCPYHPDGVVQIQEYE